MKIFTLFQLIAYFTRPLMFMASGANYTKYAAPAPATFMGAEWAGKVRAMFDSYTFASEAIGTLVNVGILKKDEVYLGCEITNGALGTSVALQLGDAADDDRYMVAQACASAGNLVGKTAVTGMGYKATADTPLVIKTSGGTATGYFGITIYKAVPN